MRKLLLSPWIRRSAVSVAVVLGALTMARAEEMPLPSEAEVGLLSTEAVRFYESGLASLDRANYPAAMNSFVRAGMLAPQASTVNELAGVLAIKLARSAKGDEARAHFDTAIACLKQVLANPAAPADQLRRVSTKLKIAQDERDAVAARDARRESLGNLFVQRLNRSYRTPRPSPTPTPRVRPQQGQFNNFNNQGQGLQQVGLQQSQGVQDTGLQGGGSYFGNPTVGRPPAANSGNF